MKRFILFIVILSYVSGYGQVGINTDNSDPDGSSMLDVKSTSKGVLVPRMTSIERDAISNPATGLLIFCTDNKLFYSNKGSPSSPNWVMINTQWINNGQIIYYNGGNVGIGEITPTHKLTIHTTNPDGAVLRLIGPTSIYGYGARLDFGDNGRVSLREDEDDKLLISTTGGTRIVGGNVGIGTSTPNASAMLDIKSTTEGILIPRLIQTQRNTISSPATGLMVYQTDNSPGFYYYDGSGWFKVGSSGSSLTNSKILIGDASNKAVEENVTGDATLSNSGVLTIIPGAVNSSKILNYSIYGVDINGNAGIAATKIYAGNVDNTEFDYLDGLTGNIQNQIDDESTLRQNTDNDLQTELNTTQTGAGLNSDGTYTPPGGVNYINTATSLYDADYKLALQVSTNASDIATNASDIATNTIAIVANNAKFGSAGTVEASKAVVVDASRDISNFNDIQADGTITSGSSIVIDGTGTTMGTITESHGKISFGDETLVTTGSIGIGTTTPSASAAFEINSSSLGFLPSRVADTTAISTPAEGLQVYDLSSHCMRYYNGTKWSACMGISVWSCGDLITINHVVGTVAPVFKTVTYSTVTNIPGETSKCWITSNLGADHQGAAVNDGTEASAGWYWQFNRKQGYKHDGTTRTPNTTWISSISEDLDWQAANDPCTLELGSGWRIPTYTEWYNVDASGGWTNWNGPWNSGLKMHAAGFIYYSDGSLNNRGSNGYYWGGTQSSTINGWVMLFLSSICSVNNGNKAYGNTLRCLRD